MLSALTEENSPFINEGKNILIEEFGSDYATYFSILACIASGTKTRSEIEHELGNDNIGSYLQKLENYYGLIHKSLPIFSKTSGKKVRFVIDDCFLIFWFRFSINTRDWWRTKLYSPSEQSSEGTMTRFPDLCWKNILPGNSRKKGGIS